MGYLLSKLSLNFENYICIQYRKLGYVEYDIIWILATYKLGPGLPDFS
jgi:hypothetical protein